MTLNFCLCIQTVWGGGLPTLYLLNFVCVFELTGNWAIKLPVYTHLYIQVRMHVCTCVRVRTYTHVYIHTCTYVCTYVRMHTYLHLHIHTYTYVCKCLYVRTSTYTNTLHIAGTSPAYNYAYLMHDIQTHFTLQVRVQPITTHISCTIYKSSFLECLFLQGGSFLQGGGARA